MHATIHVRHVHVHKEQRTTCRGVYGSQPFTVVLIETIRCSHRIGVVDRIQLARSILLRRLASCSASDNGAAAATNGAAVLLRKHRQYWACTCRVSSMALRAPLSQASSGAAGASRRIAACAIICC